jgi:hypothetical protein
MDCSYAQDLIGAVIDGQASADDRAALDAHVAGCASCEEQWTAAREVDADLRRLFAPRREAAAALTERIARRITDGPSSGLAVDAALAADAASAGVVSRLSSRVSLHQVVSWLAAMAAGFLLAVLVFQPWTKPTVADPQPQTAQQGASREGAKSEVVAASRNADVRPPVARLVVATGDVTMRPAPEADWSAVSPSPSSAVPCQPGTTLRTQPGVRCEMQTAEGCVIRMNDDSELTVRSARSLELHKGQVWCSAPDDVAMEVSTSVPAEDSAPCTKNAAPPVERSWTFRCPSNASLISAVGEKGDVRLTAARGEVEVRAGEASRRLPPGQTVSIRDGQFAQLPHHEDALLAATWIDALLVKKGHADPELLARVNGLLAQIGQAKASFLYEQELRGLGEHCVLPLLRYVQSSPSADEREQRHKAMRIVADLAPSWTVGDLIGLLDDDDDEVRFQAAAALRRLTGQSHGREPQAWKSPRTDCTPTVAIWQTWWTKNRIRYPVPEFTKEVPALQKGSKKT